MSDVLLLASYNRMRKGFVAKKNANGALADVFRAFSILICCSSPVFAQILLFEMHVF